MYWQVYLHKTGIVAEQLLIKTLQRAKELLSFGERLECSGPLLFFMENTIDKNNFDENVLNKFAQLDDVDVLSAIKLWQHHSDFVLSNLCSMILHRRLLNIKLKNNPINTEKLQKHFHDYKTKHHLSDTETSYFVFSGEIQNQAYDQENQNINILRSNGKSVDVAQASDYLNRKVLSSAVTKYYMCYPKRDV